MIIQEVMETPTSVTGSEVVVGDALFLCELLKTLIPSTSTTGTSTPDHLRLLSITTPGTRTILPGSFWYVFPRHSSSNPSKMNQFATDGRSRRFTPVSLNGSASLIFHSYIF